MMLTCTQAPEFFPTTPSLAIPKAISNAGLDASQIDFYDINEAFSVGFCANQTFIPSSSFVNLLWCEIKFFILLFVGRDSFKSETSWA